MCLVLWLVVAYVLHLIFGYALKHTQGEIIEIMWNRYRIGEPSLALYFQGNTRRMSDIR